MAGDVFKSKPKTPPPKNLKVFNCPSCGAGVVLRAAGLSVSAVCGSCAAIIDSTNENYKVILQASKKGIRTQVIPLGQRGKLHGTLWEVIGYMERADGSGMYSWSEYLLFNPQKSFRWLTEFDGHWNYVITIKGQPEKHLSEARERVSYLNKSYYLFHSGSARIIYAIGEFYWQVNQGEKVSVHDYIAPPEVLSLEKNENEAIWSLGSYIESNDVKKAFNITQPMPLKLGVAPNQPSTMSSLVGDTVKAWAFFLGILFLLQFIFILSADNEIVYSGRFSYSQGDPEKVKVSTPFNLPNNSENIEIELSASVDNSWLEVQGELINNDNGETLEFEQGVEYYFGRDSDGSWTEGSQYNRKIISSLPRGFYHFNIEAIYSKNENIPYDIVIKRDVPTWSNFLWALVLISIFPVFVWWRSRSFEVGRWSQSDFSPYFNSEE